MVGNVKPVESAKFWRGRYIIRNNFETEIAKPYLAWTVQEQSERDMATIF